MPSDYAEEGGISKAVFWNLPGSDGAVRTRVRRAFEDAVRMPYKSACMSHRFIEWQQNFDVMPPTH